jgi:hypothetical protein
MPFGGGLIAGCPPLGADAETVIRWLVALRVMLID